MRRETVEPFINSVSRSWWARRGAHCEERHGEGPSLANDVGSGYAGGLCLSEYTYKVRRCLGGERLGCELIGMESGVLVDVHCRRGPKEEPARSSEVLSLSFTERRSFRGRPIPCSGCYS